MNVTVYGTKVCPNCTKVKNYLETKQISYSYNSVGEDISKEDLEGIVQHPVRAVPVIVVDGEEQTFEQLRQLTVQPEQSLSFHDLKL